MTHLGQDYSGWSDEKLAQRNADSGTRLNHAEVAALLAIAGGHDEPRLIAAETGLTLGQAINAVAVLAEQGLAERETAA